MKRLIKTIEFYSDGTYEEIMHDVESKEKAKEDMLNKIFNNLNSSRKIMINVAMYMLIKNHYDADVNKIGYAVKDISEHQGIIATTVYDKLYRALDWFANNYQEALHNALKHNNKELKEKLLDNVGARTKKGDEELIKKYIK